MLRGYIEFDPTLLDDYAEWFGEAIEDLTIDAGQSTFDAIQEPLLDELGYVPGKVKYPIQWTSEKQRKAFFATDGFGNGIPYQRTGRGAKSWFVKHGLMKNGYRITVGSNWTEAQFVYGTLNFRSMNEALKPMQQFHRNTGWVPVSETVRFWFDAAQETFEKEFDNEISELKVRRRSRR